MKPTSQTRPAPSNMRDGRHLGWLVAAGAVLLASALAVWIQTDMSFLSSSLRPVATDFAYPGTTIWWLTLGGPFRAAPTSLDGCAVAVIANAACWLGVVKLGAVTIRFVASKLNHQ